MNDLYKQEMLEDDLTDDEVAEICQSVITSLELAEKQRDSKAHKGEKANDNII